LSATLRLRLALVTLVACATAGSDGHGNATSSTCHGSVSRGSLDGGVPLPVSGSNFSAYTSLARMLGRTYVHARVRDIVVDAYARLERDHPDLVFVYGETGFAEGGRFYPHRTHQNGLSVDFFVPVRDAGGRAVTLPTTVANRYGYSIEFDRDGRWQEYTLDFEALAAHLIALDAAAKAHDAGIALVIFEPAWLPRLYATRHGNALRSNLRFMSRPAWVRHDEHYHVDFAVRCRPLR